MGWRDIQDRIAGKASRGAKRSSQWRKVRDTFLTGKRCLVCGGRKSLIAHHEVPFHIAPDMDLAPENLMALCERGKYGVNCHLLIGHIGSWRRINVTARADAAYWRVRLQ